MGAAILNSNPAITGLEPLAVPENCRTSADLSLNHADLGHRASFSGGLRATTFEHRKAGCGNLQLGGI
jgi:hypothetical protein